MMQELLNRVERLWRRTEDIPAFQWAEVRSVSPLKVRFDGVGNDSAGSPSTVVHGLKTGDRVLCLVRRNRVTVIGSAGTNTFATKTALDTWAAPDGAIAYVTADNNQYFRRNGSWMRQPLIITGSYPFSESLAPNAGVDPYIAFPQGVFTSPPQVFASVDNGIRLNVSTRYVTENEFQVRVFNFTSATASGHTAINWYAFSS